MRREAISSKDLFSEMGSGGDGGDGGVTVTGAVQVISSKGCSKLMVGFSNSFPSFRDLQSLEPSMSPVPSSITSRSIAPSSSSPFLGLVICVTGLSKEARKQVMDATERLGGQYSPNLHPHCTHLVVQSFGGRKLGHALKHGAKNGLFVVTLGWFVDSVRRNVRLSESLYSVKNSADGTLGTDNLNQIVGLSGGENSPFAVGIHEDKKLETAEESRVVSYGRKSKKSVGPRTLSGQSLFIDSDISDEMRNKVAEASTREGATLVDMWFAGCDVSHVVCEGTSVSKYLGHFENLVTPLWVLKTAKEKYAQRLIHMSTDLARQLGTALENYQNGTGTEGPKETGIFLQPLNRVKERSQTERQQLVNLAKLGIRNRRRRRMQTCQTPMKPITPSSLLESICWSISEPTATASIYTDSFRSEDNGEHQTPTFFSARVDGKDSETGFSNLTRPLTESEKNELIFKHHFLTLLFPTDRFAELGPSSRTFFSDSGFTCIQVLDHIYAFYQENMSAHEIEVAIHTDSRHADRLRTAYASKESTERGSLIFRRIDFLGSRRSFEMLKRVTGSDNSSNVYELLIRA